MNERPPYPVRKAARKAARIAAEDLNMLGKYLGRPTFTVRWLTPEEIDGNRGQVRGTDEHSIYLRNDLSPTAAARTVFHESRHLQRLREGKISALQARLSREDVEKEERIANGRMQWLWREHRHEFEREPWFDADS